MLAEKSAVRREKQHRAVESADLALDDPQHEIDAAGFGGRCERVGRRPWYVDRAVEVSPERVASFRGPHADARAKVEPLRVRRYKRLWKDDQSRASLRRVRGQLADLGERCQRVEDDRCVLYHGGDELRLRHLTPRTRACLRPGDVRLQLRRQHLDRSQSSAARPTVREPSPSVWRRFAPQYAPAGRPRLATHRRCQTAIVPFSVRTRPWWRARRWGAEERSSAGWRLPPLSQVWLRVWRAGQHQPLRTVLYSIFLREPSARHLLGPGRRGR